MSSRLLTSVVRPAQYRSSRSDGSSCAIAEQYVRTSPVPIVMPAARSSRPKPTSTGANGACSGTSTRSGTGGYLCQALAYQLKVVPVLDHGAQRVIRRLTGQVGLTEELECPDPVDGLCHPRRLG